MNMTLFIALIAAVASFHMLSIPKFIRAHQQNKTAGWWVYAFAGVETAITTTCTIASLLTHHAPNATYYLLIPIILTAIYSAFLQEKTVLMTSSGRILTILTGVVAISIAGNNPTCTNCLSVGYIATAALTLLMLVGIIHLDRKSTNSVPRKKSRMSLF